MAGTCICWHTLDEDFRDKFRNVKSKWDVYFECDRTDFFSWVKFKIVNEEFFFTLIYCINDSERIVKGYLIHETLVTFTVGSGFCFFTCTNPKWVSSNVQIQEMHLKYYKTLQYTERHTHSSQSIMSSLIYFIGITASSFCQAWDRPNSLWHTQGSSDTLNYRHLPDFALYFRKKIS